MEKGYTLGRMEKNMKETFLMIYSMGLGFAIIQMGKFMKGNGIMEYNMAKVLLI